MKKIFIIMLLLLTTNSVFSQINIWVNEVFQDTSHYNSVNKIPTCPVRGFTLFYYQDTLRGIDSLCVIHNLTKKGGPFFIELTDDGENAIPVGRKLLPTTRVTYNGTVIAPTQWTGVGTRSITLFLDTRKHDQLIVEN